LWLVLLAATLAPAAEQAVLHTGFRVRVERHEADGDTTRLFLPGGGVVEVRSSDIRGFEQEEYAPLPPAPRVDPTAPRPPAPPKRDLAHEPMARVLDGKMLLQWHCYRADEMQRMLEVAREFGAGVIAGYLKGAPQEAGPAARERLAAAVLELAPVADRLKTPLLIEAVNRYESPVGHSLADTWDIARRAASPFVQILPDTFHMNIEEANMEQALRTHRACFSSLHLSDNTRHFPGFGALDFAAVIAILDGLGYQGKLAIEGNVRTSFAADVEVAMQCLGPLLARTTD
jgi:hydroxypyruvate isomerase